jgi:hypothetical protein
MDLPLAFPIALAVAWVTLITVSLLATPPIGRHRGVAMHGRGK